jgi:hypothetical protein
MRTTLLVGLSLLSLHALGACGRSDGSLPTPDAPLTPGVDAPIGPGPDAPGPSAVSIASLRMNQPVNLTPVNLANVVVTARVTSKKSGNVWVQDAGGGMYSGIHLFCNYGGTTPSCTMTQAEIDALAVGQVVNVSGKFSTFTPTMPAGAPQLEITSPTITAAGSTMTPVAIDVTAATLAKDQSMVAGADPYKGAYVRITPGPLPVSSITATEFATTCTSSTGTAGTTFSGFEATGGGKTLAVGLRFYSTLTYCIPACGYPCTNPVTNQNFKTIAGIVEPATNKNGSAYLEISPVQDTDLAQ